MLELLGLRTVIYPAPDLRAATNWFTGLLGQEPYFAGLYYVGYNVAGYELALDPNADPADGPRTYWGVSDADVRARPLGCRSAASHRSHRCRRRHPRRHRA